MNKALLEKLRILKPVLAENYGIEEFAVFGSTARGEETDKSDIDIAITKMRKKNYFAIIDAMHFLESTLHKKVDMGLFDSIRPFIKRRITEDLIYV